MFVTTSLQNTIGSRKRDMESIVELKSNRLQSAALCHKANRECKALEEQGREFFQALEEAVEKDEKTAVRELWLDLDTWPCHIYSESTRCLLWTWASK